MNEIKFDVKENLKKVSLISLTNYGNGISGNGHSLKINFLSLSLLRTLKLIITFNSYSKRIK